MSLIIVDSLPRAITMLANKMRESVTLDVFDEEKLIGYWLTIKANPKAPEDLDRRELAREVRKYRNPQPYDIEIQEWPAWMYAGMNRGERSSAL